MSDPLSDDLVDHYPLSAQDGAYFRENGYVKLKGVLRAATLAHFSRAISADVERLTPEDFPKAMADRTTYQKAFIQISNLWTLDAEVRRFAFAPKLARLAADLLGVEGVRMYHDQALYKEPGGGITPWHADQYYWPVSTDRTVTAWIPLQRTPLEMGPLAFARKTHRMAFGRELAISDESETLIQKSLAEAQADIDEGPFELGDVSFHLGWTFHRAGPNRTGEARRVMTVIYVDEDIRLSSLATKAHVVDRDKWCPGLQPGDLLASPLNPVLWSRKTARASS